MWIETAHCVFLWFSRAHQNSYYAAGLVCLFLRKYKYRKSHTILVIKGSITIQVMEFEQYCPAKSDRRPARSFNISYCKINFLNDNNRTYLKLLRGKIFLQQLSKIHLRNKTCANSYSLCLTFLSLILNMVDFVRQGKSQIISQNVIHFVVDFPKQLTYQKQSHLLI